MGILSRSADILSANVNAFLDGLEEKNAVKMIDQNLRKCREDLSEVKKETGAVMAAETAAKRDLDECQASIKKYANAAANAVRAGNDDDARKLLASKQRLEAQLGGFQATYDAAHKDAQDMQAMYDKLVGDIEAMEQRANMLKGKVSVAKAREHANKVTSGVGSPDSTASFDRLEDSINKRLDKASAVAELDKRASSGEDLLKQYGGGVPASSVDDELAKLKAELGQG